jgi:hypothetical protein
VLDEDLAEVIHLVARERLRGCTACASDQHW